MKGWVPAEVFYPRNGLLAEMCLVCLAHHGGTASAVRKVVHVRCADRYVVTRLADEQSRIDGRVLRIVGERTVVHLGLVAAPRDGEVAEIGIYRWWHIEPG